MLCVIKQVIRQLTNYFLKEIIHKECNIILEFYFILHRYQLATLLFKNKYF